MRSILILMCCHFGLVHSQGYTEYLTGNPNDVTVAHQFGVCLMGGASENDQGMIWFLNKANGGDVVVLRASGSDGYNNYMFSELGVSINSIRTFVISDESGATHPYVLEKVAQAEAIWFAGGDQFDYVNLFKDNDLEDALNSFVNNKGGVIGGTSAGMAILGSSYFSAENGTITSAQALGNPFDFRMTLGYDDFLELPFLNKLITDTHYDDPDRRARHAVFLSRYARDNTSRAFGIACNEYTAVCIDQDGKAYVFGEFPVYDEFAFFIQSNCVEEFLPEICSSNSPLTWNRNGEAIKVYKVPGTLDGNNYFDLADWQSGNGGTWENWHIVDGQFFSNPTQNANCFNVLNTDDVRQLAVIVYPNPFSNAIHISTNRVGLNYKLYDIHGKTIALDFKGNTAMTEHLGSGLYFLSVVNGQQHQQFKLLKL